jgi:hypothetical protein
MQEQSTDYSDLATDYGDFGVHGDSGDKQWQ